MDDLPWLQQPPLAKKKHTIPSVTYVYSGFEWLIITIHGTFTSKQLLQCSHRGRFASVEKVIHQIQYRSPRNKVRMLVNKFIALSVFQYGCTLRSTDRCRVQCHAYCTRTCFDDSDWSNLFVCGVLCVLICPNLFVPTAPVVHCLTQTDLVSQKRVDTSL